MPYPRGFRREYCESVNSGSTLPKDKAANRYVLGGAERMPVNPRKQ